ncbi:MAG: aminotransferase class I/II-fold pyridoxal phosphate-dependent enzyme [Syntrophorhabdaceae bacterium]|nr:aminotransferase class I/II-fold pyridoxal phosphate-dependent enzyme [Syntrophorhabdaceae bacterium]
MKRDIPDIHDLAASKKVSLPRIMDFTTTVNPVGPSAKAKNAVRKSLKIIDRHPDRNARYLLRSIARSEGVSEENIFLGESFETLTASILRAVDARMVLCAAPYPAYYQGLPDGPAHMRFCPLDRAAGFSLDIEGWLREMKECDAAILPCPSFLSAVPAPMETVGRIVAQAGEKGTFLIIDQTLREYSEIPSLSADITGHERCLVVRSLSEYYALAGLPVSYAVGAPATLENIRRRSSMGPPNTLAAAAAVESLRDRTYRQRTRSFMKRESSFIDNSLRGMRGVSFFTTVCGSFVITLDNSPSKPLETFRRYRIVIDSVGNAATLFFPVKDHKWNARYLKTLKNIMGA